MEETMTKFTTGYRGHEIVRDGDEPYRIFKDGKLATEATFYSFGDARREVDHLTGTGTFNDEDEDDDSDVDPGRERFGSDHGL
jgi:hypothetical protein